MIDYTVFRNTPYWLNFLFAGQVFNVDMNATVNANSTKYYEIITDANYIHHMLQFNVVTTAKSDILIELYEAPTVTDGTISITPINLDRRKSKVSKTLFYSNPSGVSSGLMIQSLFIVTGNTIGSTTYGNTELILKKATKYVVKVQNLGAQNTDCYIKILYYESSN